MTNRVSLRLTAIIPGAVLSGLLGSSLVWAQAIPDNPLWYELLNRMDRLEQEMRQMRGDLELYLYRQEEAVQQQQALYGDLDRRLQVLEEDLGIAEAADETPAPAIEHTLPDDIVGPPDEDEVSPPARRPPPTATASSAEQQAYEDAFNMLRQGRYEQAIAAFQGFLESYPDSPLAGNAQYWLGETYYVTREFARARDAFLALGTQYPQHEMLPDALLRLGMTYQELNERNNARQVLQELIQIYPDSRAAELAEQRLQVLR